MASYLILPAFALISVLNQSGCKPERPKAKTANSPAPSAPVIQPVLGRVPDIVIPAGTLMKVRLNHALSTASNRRGDRFTGTLVASVAPGGRTALPRGAAIEGLVRRCEPSGQPNGRAVLAVSAISVELDGRVYGFATSPVVRTSDAVAGTAVGSTQAASRSRQQVGLPAETVLTFRLNQPLAVKRPA